jgi:hypothetical protein
MKSLSDWARAMLGRIAAMAVIRRYLRPSSILMWCRPLGRERHLLDRDGVGEPIIRRYLDTAPTRRAASAYCIRMH